MSFDGFSGVTRTGRQVPTTRGAYRRRRLVQADQAQHETLHHQRPSLPARLEAPSSWVRQSDVASTIDEKRAVSSWRLPETRKAPIGDRPGCQPAAKAARTRRRARFRSTALPNRRPMAIANCGCSLGRGTYIIRIGPLRTRRPLSAKSAKILRLRIRQITHSGACGPWPASTATRLDHHGSLNGDGTRAYGPACGYWVGTCASRKLLPERIAGSESGLEMRTWAHPA